MVSIGNDVNGAEVAGDDRIVHDPVLEPAQIVVECHDVLFKGDPRGEGYPTLGSLHPGRRRREPFVQAFGSSDEAPHGVSICVDEAMASNGAHEFNLVGETPVDCSEAMSLEMLTE